MYTLSRLMLTLAVALFAYCAVLGVVRAALLVPPARRGLTWTVVAVGAVAVIARRRGRRLFTSGGTAAWANLRELAKKGMLANQSGLIVGRVPTEGTPLGGAVTALLNPRLGAREACGDFFHSLNRRKRKQGRLVSLPQAVHTSVYAPTGLGKGAALIVPFLKTCEESCIVVDGKDGELARLTAATRRKMGHLVVLLDPSRLVTSAPDSLNLLDFIDRDSPQAVNEAAAIANALVIRTGEEKEPHWLDKAEAYLRSLIATTIWYGDPALGTRSLLNVAEIASHPEMLKTALQLMQKSPEVWNGSLARMGGMLSHSVGEELSSTLSTVGRFISFMNDPSVAASLKSSSFDLAKLRKPNEKISIYLIQRAADSRTAAPLLRLWLNACIREVMKGGLRHEGSKVHAIVDEANLIGRMDCFADVLNVGRGFSLHLQLYYQDIGQLKRCWENPQGVLANTTQIFFGVNDKDTAEYVSARLGPETIVVDSGGRNSGWSRNSGTSSGSSHSQSTGSSYSGGASSSWQQQSRELLKPAEVAALDPRIAITLTPGVRPIWTRLVRYYEEKLLFGPRGWLGRMAAAVRTLLASMALLAFAVVTAAAVSSEFNEALARQETQEQGLSAFEMPPGPIPPASGGTGKHNVRASTHRSNPRNPRKGDLRQ